METRLWCPWRRHNTGDSPFYMTTLKSKEPSPLLLRFHCKDIFIAWDKKTDSGRKALSGTSVETRPDPPAHRFETWQSQIHSSVMVLTANISSVSLSRPHWLRMRVQSSTHRVGRLTIETRRLHHNVKLASVSLVTAVADTDLFLQMTAVCICPSSDVYLKSSNFSHSDKNGTKFSSRQVIVGHSDLKKMPTQ